MTRSGPLRRKSGESRKNSTAPGKLRSAEQTSTGLKRTPIRRNARMKATNPDRRAKTYARNYGTRGAAVRALGCLAGPHCCGDIQAAHSIARGMGGAKGDRRDLVPLCWSHHNEAGERGTTQRTEFEAFYGLDLQAEAARIAEQLDGEGHE